MIETTSTPISAQKTALITGIAGQDGCLLAELLLSKGYSVYGTVRNLSFDGLSRISHLESRIQLVAGDLLDQNSLARMLEEAQPDEVYNLAAHSFVPASWKEPVQSGEFSALGVTRLLEAIRQVNPVIRFFQAASSELFGIPQEVPQRETTLLHPRSPYGVAKMYAYWMTVNYREFYGMHACSGILYNHESERRGLEFVTRKITSGAARIKLGLSQELQLGSLDARRDWGYARDYVEAMWLMLQQETADDYVIATGETHSVEEFVMEAFGCVDLDWRKYVRTDPAFVRPPETAQLVGDPSKICSALGWKPKTSFRELVSLMVHSDLRAARESIK
jgi:GDPmannose 4,6-dehydratase